MSVETHQKENGVLQITLHDPEKRNALGIAMFNGIDEGLLQVTNRTGCVLLSGEGNAFCSGFDMKACTNDLSILSTYITRLSILIRSLRRLPVPVVCAAHGTAIAGGCAILTGCDFVVGSINGMYGYPVHRIGISPAVTIPTLFQKLGHGRARALVMSGELINGTDAFSIGLLSHLEESDEKVVPRAIELAESLAQKPPQAMQATKQWLNELDGSLDDALFELPANDSSSLIGDETQEMLQKLWKK
jgi:methylglutaconyl-CoA hydratase